MLGKEAPFDGGFFEESMAMERNSSERRSSPRYPIEIPIEVTVGSEMLIHLTANLSGHGAFFERAIPYAVGTRASLRVLLPGERAIRCQGEIVNIPDKKGFGMGMRFLDLPAEDEQRLEQFAARYRRDTDEPLGP